MARRAGDEAAARRAFEAAAGHYREALSHGPVPPDEALELLRTLAECEAQGGHSESSADAYGRAIELAPAAERPELQIAQIDQLLRGGRVGPALEHGVDALRQLGLSVPRSPTGALVSLVFRRALVLLRGLRWRPRAEAEVAPEVLRKLDLLGSLAVGIGVIDHIRGADFNARYLLRALRFGEPGRVARAIMQEGAFRAAQGDPERGIELVQHAIGLLRGVQDPSLHTLGAMCLGVCRYYGCHFSTSVRALAEAEASFSDHARGHQRRELTVLRQLLLFALMHYGDMTQLLRRLRAYTDEGERRGDLFALGGLRGRAVIGYLAEDDVAEAQRNAELTLQGWPVGPFYAQHWCSLGGRADVALYCGDFEEAGRLLEGQHKALSRSMLLQVPLVDIEYAHLRGRVAVLRAASGKDDRARAMAESCARRCESHRIDFGRALGRLLRASLARQAGDDVRAANLLGEAQIYFESTGALIWSTASMSALGGLVGGDEGAALRAESERRYRQHGVKNLTRMTAALVPGLCP